MKSSFYQTIYSSISEAINEDYESITSQRSLHTNNSKYSLKWDLINSNILERLTEENIEVKIVKAGCWSFLLILNKNDMTLYSLMNSKRYETICSSPEKNAPLYIQALKELNSELGFAMNPLFDLTDSNSELANRLKRMCNLFSNSTDFSKITYKILTFTTYEKSVVDMCLKTLDTRLNELRSEKLMDYIIPNFDNSVAQMNEDEIKMPALKITKKAEKRKGEKESVSLKSQEILLNKQA